MCQVLPQIYSEILEEQFHYNTLGRRKLQSIVYLLKNMGINVGDYGFKWDKHGPYSIALDMDAYSCSKKNESQSVIFSEKAMKTFTCIKEMVSQKTVYDDVIWLESIAALHFLRYVLRVSKSDAVLMKELVNRINYLDNRQENENALQIAKQVDVV